MNVIWVILNLSTAIQIAETVSVAGKWVNTDLIENRNCIDIRRYDARFVKVYL